MTLDDALAQTVSDASHCDPRAPELAPRHRDVTASARAATTS
jgi:hypothetical protein